MKRPVSLPENDEVKEQNKKPIYFQFVLHIAFVNV
jgi:hypothetical protein